MDIKLDLTGMTFEQQKELLQMQKELLQMNNNNEEVFQLNSRKKRIKNKQKKDRGIAPLCFRGLDEDVIKEDFYENFTKGNRAVKCNKYKALYLVEKIEENIPEIRNFSCRWKLDEVDSDEIYVYYDNTHPYIINNPDRNKWSFKCSPYQIDVKIIDFDDMIDKELFVETLSEIYGIPSSMVNEKWLEY